MMGRNAAPTGNEQQDSGRKGLGILLRCKIMTSEPINKVRIGGYIDGVCIELALEECLDECTHKLPKTLRKSFMYRPQRCALVASLDEI